MTGMTTHFFQKMNPKQFVPPHLRLAKTDGMTGNDEYNTICQTFNNASDVQE
jgi:hypothetical protein